MMETSRKKKTELSVFEEQFEPDFTLYLEKKSSHGYGDEKAKKQWMGPIFRPRQARQRIEEHGGRFNGSQCVSSESVRPARRR